MPPGARTEQTDSCPRGAPSLGDNTKSQHDPGFMKLGRGVTQPGIVGIDFIKDDIELCVLKHEWHPSMWKGVRVWKLQKKESWSQNFQVLMKPHTVCN